MWGPGIHRPLVFYSPDDLLWTADLTGYLYCLDRKTGALHWKEDLFATVWGSPAGIDGKIYIGDEDVDVAVYRAAKTLEKLSEVNMGSAVYCTPVAANGVLYIATRKELFAIAEPRQGEPAAAATQATPRAEAPRSAEADAWASFRGGPTLEGRRPGKVSDSPRLLWTFDSKAQIESTAAIVGDRVWVGTDDKCRFIPTVA